MGTFIRTQFSLQGLLNELSYIHFVPPQNPRKVQVPFLCHLLPFALTCMLLLLNPADLCSSQANFCLSKNHRGFQVSTKTCPWFISAWHSTHSFSPVSTVMQVIPAPDGVRTGNPTRKNRKADSWLGLGVQELLHLSFGKGGVQTQNLGVPNLARD